MRPKLVWSLKVYGMVGPLGFRHPKKTKKFPIHIISIFSQHHEQDTQIRNVRQEAFRVIEIYVQLSIFTVLTNSKIASYIVIFGRVVDL